LFLPLFFIHRYYNMSSTLKHLHNIPKPTTILKEGLVTKQGGRIKTWKRRWCVLSNVGLLYYKTEPTATMKYHNLQGHIELGSIEAVESVSDKEKQKKKACFKIVTPGRVFLMSAESEQDMESWIHEIQALITSDTKEPELFLQIVRVAMPKRQEIDYHSKSLEELEEAFTKFEETMNNEINHFVDICLQESNGILDELAKREITEVEHKSKKEKDDIALELKRRSIANQ